MPTKKVLKKHLSPELMQQVEDALGDDFDWNADEDVVPRSRLNKVIGQRNDARTQLQALQAGKADDDDDDDDGDGAASKVPTTSPKGKTTGSGTKGATVAELKAQHDQEIQSLKVQYAALDMLRGAGARDAQMLFNSSRIDKSKVVFDATGKLTGLSEQIDLMKKDAETAYLFGGSGGLDSVEFGTGKSSPDSSQPQISQLDARLGQNLARFGLAPIDNKS